jgi:hypothetical protein
VIDGKIVVEKARILCGDIDGLAECRPGFAMERVTMRGGLDLGSCVMDCGMNVEACHLPVRGFLWYTDVDRELGPERRVYIAIGRDQD